jgi:hypothetical protein
MFKDFAENITTHHVVTLLIVAVAILTVVMAAAACLHVLGRITIRPPYADWLVCTLLFGLLGSTAYAVNTRLREEGAKPVAVLTCDKRTLAAITDQATFSAAMKTAECRELIEGWLTAFNRFGVTDARLVNALAEALPTRNAGEADLDWFNRIREVAEEHPVLGPLRKRARERDAPFLPTTEQMRIGKPQREPAMGEVYVDRKELDGQLVQVSSHARRHCILRLRAKNSLPTSTSEMPLFHFNAAQRTYLLGTTSIADPSGTKPGRYSWARSGDIAFDPSDSDKCGASS